MPKFQPIIDIGPARNKSLFGVNGIESNSKRIRRKGRIASFEACLLVVVPGALLRYFQNSDIVNRLLGHSQLMGLMISAMIYASIPSYKALLKCLKEEQHFVRRFFVYIEYAVLMIIAVVSSAFVVLSWVAGDF